MLYSTRHVITLEKKKETAEVSVDEIEKDKHGILLRTDQNATTTKRMLLCDCRCQLDSNAWD